MDGNGRWAERRGLPRPLGHREGSEAVRRTTRACRRAGVRALTLFAFSEQNWERSRLEVDALMALLCEFLLSEREELIRNGITLRSAGRIHRLPASVRSVLTEIERDTAHLSDMTLTLALSYGGREEIATAAKELASQVALGKMRPDDVTPEALHRLMPSLSVVDPDLVIRTGGERRISNFMLYGLAYAELYFADVLWPDFGAPELYEAIASYQARERRFGNVGKPAAPIAIPSGSTLRLAI